MVGMSKGCSQCTSGCCLLESQEILLSGMCAGAKDSVPSGRTGGLWSRRVVGLRWPEEAWIKKGVV